ncbi:molybdenum ABC transporter ATP-binding protein [Pleionea sediminis]|uniref:molybdenum ABC transporter ATP-binding protein n=1 Tax=Pleionea sediminis TaxID=2569479 RepID=UPI001185BA92|nr:molybdenum ABC transporter ATP-binding protein [Pleionea sediminis]
MFAAGLSLKVKKQFPKFLLDVSCEVASSGVTAVFGHSGCGKTTLLRCIAGLESFEGRLSFKRQVWKDNRETVATHSRAIGYVFQEPSLFSHLDVERNLVFAEKRSKRAAIIERKTIIDVLGISALLSKFPEELSGGEKQRVAIARALLSAPDLILMDEPLASLDYHAKKRFLRYVTSVKKLGVPIIYVSHSIDEVCEIADDIIYMDQGQLVSSGKLVDVLTEPAIAARLEEEAGSVISGEVTRLDDQWMLAGIQFGDNLLWIKSSDLTIKQNIRLRIKASDVSLSLTKTPDSSIVNQLEGVVDSLSKDFHPALSLVSIRVGSDRMLARVTKKSINDMSLKMGSSVWVNIKSAAVVS